MNHFQHPSALCESTEIGQGTRIWAFAHILDGAKIGRDCNICDGVFIENDVVVGDRVTVKCGVQLWNGVRLANDVFVGPNATFTNDLFPRSKNYPESFQQTIVEEGASIGANATILPGLTIGRGAMIGAGAVVTRSVPPNAIAVGNPARIKGYVEAHSVNPILPPDPGNGQSMTTDGFVTRMPVFSDIRGSLSVGNFGAEIPFVPARYFIVFGVPSRETRGAHAHRVCHQFLVCVSGSCKVLIDDGKMRTEVALESSSIGIHLPPMTWGTQYDYSDDAVLLVFASHAYDPDEYIRTYEEFIALVRDPPGD